MLQQVFNPSYIQTKERHTFLCDGLLFLTVSPSYGYIDAYRKLSEKESHLSQEIALSQSMIFPLRKENARVQKENHQLHQELIDVKEQLARFERTEKRGIKQTQRELDQMQDVLTGFFYKKYVYVFSILYMLLCPLSLSLSTLLFRHGT